jgi:quinol monooxygenase YgiN
MSSPGGVVVVIRYRALPGREQVARTELARLVAKVLAEEGACRGIRMLIDAGDPASILLVEEWPDRASYLGPHFETPHLKAFVARAGEWFAGPPEIGFWDEVGLGGPGASPG